MVIRPQNSSIAWRLVGNVDPSVNSPPLLHIYICRREAGEAEPRAPRAPSGQQKWEWHPGG